MQKSFVIVSSYYMKNTLYEHLSNLKNLMLNEEITINLEVLYSYYRQFIIN